MLEKAKVEKFILREKLFDDRASQVQKYQELVLGRPGVLNLIKYELIIMVSSWVPGALGLVLRSKLYRRLLGKVGKGVIFGTNVVLRHPHKITLGQNVVIDDNCVLDAKGADNAGIVIGNRVFIGRNSIIYCKDGDIFIGDNSTLAFNCEIFSANVVRLGENVLMAAYTYLNGGTHASDRTDIPVLRQERSGKGIIVEDNVWLGGNVKVVDGITIGRDAIVAVGSVVDKDIPPFSIAAGVPARVTRMR